MQNTDLNPKTLILINALFSAQVLHEALDDLSETPFYKHSLKNAVNRCEEELTKHCDRHINSLYKDKEDGLLMLNLQKSIKQIAQKIAKLNPVAIIEIAEIIENIDKEKLIYEQN